jgi:hypothetical protein
MGQGLVDVFRRAKVTSNVPAAPDVPTRVASRTRAAHADQGGIVELEDELVELALPEVSVVVPPVVGGVLACDVHADIPTAPATTTKNAPRRDGRDR